MTWQTSKSPSGSSPSWFPGRQGRILANGDDDNTMEALKGLALTTFGISEHNQVHGRGIFPGLAGL